MYTGNYQLVTLQFTGIYSSIHTSFYIVMYTGIYMDFKNVSTLEITSDPQ